RIVDAEEDMELRRRRDAADGVVPDGGDLVPLALLGSGPAGPEEDAIGLEHPVVRQDLHRVRGLPDPDAGDRGGRGAGRSVRRGGVGGSGRESEGEEHAKGQGAHASWTLTRARPWQSEGP